MRSTCVIGEDGGLNAVESAVFVEQVLDQFPEDQRAVIASVVDGGLVKDAGWPLLCIRKALYGCHGMGWHGRWSNFARLERVALKLGFIR